MRFRVMRAVAALGLIATACTSDMWGPTDDADDLVAAFESLAQDSNQLGDPDATLAYTHAAMLIRLGITPTPITLTVGSTSDQYLGFVHVVSYGAASQVALRTLVAYRLGPGNDHRAPTEVLYLAATADSQTILHPGSASPLASAEAVWRDLVNGRIWISTSGFGGVVEEATGGKCPNPNAEARVTCTLGTYRVALDGEFHPLVGNRLGNLDPSTQLVVAGRATGVNGADLEF